MEDWDTRSHLGLGDLAVSPKNPDVVVGVTERREWSAVEDGGRSFSDPAGPVLQFVSWAEDGVLVGLRPMGLSTPASMAAHLGQARQLAQRPRLSRRHLAARSIGQPTALCSCHMMAVARSPP